MRISDWSSDVCYYDIGRGAVGHPRHRLRVESGAALRVVGPHVGAGAFALNRRDRVPAINLGQRPERAQPGRRKVTRDAAHAHAIRSEEHTSELQSLMRISYAVFCLKKNTPTYEKRKPHHQHHKTKANHMNYN